ncbi:nucleotide sugar dehydrogenase [Clostridium folliculivorans]|uniref:UDP-N-acetyl-D-glucosamine dehydrogenase n=1 Tax=Clostridium folliculivorans TaxID=2886038 RepID=A0A9W6DC43_9CLOT|nr:nucleotide sugar dehydrogenase [Clostridium folliculivorans]GKU26924.1 UDP-N-acetyl-D-glucosamine dehydrogenase [Clostridium folliculivorans]GKU31575.1 UDP-N-acetyl-D-glucosamine dehydrogenase [Clostridium folliculivorans]
MSVKEELLKKINEKTAIVGVIGLGYVGLPLAVEKAKAGYKTIGFDVQANKVELVNSGVNYIGDVVDSDLSNVVKSGILTATTDFSFVKDVDFVAICVPTPLDAYQQPDISYVKASTEAVAEYLHEGMVVVLESTTYPGTTEELLLPILESKSGLKCGKDFYLAFSPERVDPGNLLYKTKNTPKVVGGVGKDSTEVAAAMYRNVLESEILEVSSPAVAEMEKILENTYRNINIGLANEMAIICEKMGISVWEVIDAAKTKPYGFQAFYPGPGLGGHCIPLDPYYLTWKAREYDYHTKLIETSGEINNYMPQYVIERAGKILNKYKKPINGSKVLILGVAYKQDIDDYRESPALKVIENFQNEGADISFYDPYVSSYKYKGVEHQGIADLTETVLRDADIVVITTMHTNMDYNYVQKNAKVIFDTKNATKNVENKENIVLL